MACIYNIGNEIAKCLECHNCSKHCPLGFSMGHLIHLYREYNTKELKGTDL